MAIRLGFLPFPQPPISFSQPNTQYSVSSLRLHQLRQRRITFAKIAPAACNSFIGMVQNNLFLSSIFSSSSRCLEAAFSLFF
ncbi:hypothetical protein Nmul_A0116 [Nitrosospira multiformis ATCC 25196]|uniref:Uncharacterized protein n=1 Tax=Nitrosospira multiformis (strain ATCC 25196 / NCIMB 11849 / C 71) TaxID=323848 RepID=Q2YCU6_NITMU|nr:hypothetical protein Nmul_A0116 [Nitrosospira multiformis ATCC 25196]